MAYRGQQKSVQTQCGFEVLRAVVFTMAEQQSGGGQVVTAVNVTTPNSGGGSAQC